MMYNQEELDAASFSIREKQDALLVSINKARKVTPDDVDITYAQITIALAGYQNAVRRHAEMVTQQSIASRIF